jgi:hypothetical protein
MKIARGKELDEDRAPDDDPFAEMVISWLECACRQIAGGIIQDVRWTKDIDDIDDRDWLAVSA